MQSVMSLSEKSHFTDLLRSKQIITPRQILHKSAGGLFYTLEYVNLFFDKQGLLTHRLLMFV